MATYFIIGGDKKEYGPITKGDMHQWIAEGRLDAQSLAKGEADASWRQLGSFPEFADALAGGPPPAIAPPGVVLIIDHPNWQADVLARSPELRFGECLGAGWSFLGANAGFVFGAVALAWLLNFVLVLCSLYIPIIGPIAALCFSAVIMGGLYVACVRRMRGEAVSPVEALSGFQTAFGQLILTGLVATLLTEFGICCLVLPAIYLGIAWVFAVPLVADKKMFFWSAMELSRKVVTRVWFEVFALLIIAFLPLVIFQMFNLLKTEAYMMDLYHQANNNWQQLLQNLQGHQEELRAVSVKMAIIGQAVLLVNLLYAVGVLMRAYENLFGSRKK